MWRWGVEDLVELVAGKEDAGYDADGPEIDGFGVAALAREAVV